MHYAHPIYTPASVAAQAGCRELNTGRVAFAGAYHGWGFHEDGALSGRRAAEHLGGRWTSVERAPASRRRPRASTTPDQARAGRAGAQRLRLPQPHLAGRPRRPAALHRRARARCCAGWRRSRPATTSATPTARCARTSTTFLAEHDIDLQGGPHPDARPPAHPRLRLQPDLRVLVPPARPASWRRSWSRCTTPTAVGTPTWSAPTQHGRADASTRSSTSRRSTTPPAPTTSPSRCPARRSTVGVTLHREGRPPFTATLTGTAGPADGALRRARVAAHPAGAPARHGPDQVPGHQAVAARPRRSSHAPNHGGEPAMTAITPPTGRIDALRWPDLAPMRASVRSHVESTVAERAVPRRRTPAAGARRARRRHRRGAPALAGSPTMQVHRPAEFFRRSAPAS